VASVVLIGWKNGKLERWKNGKVEGWKMKKLKMSDCELRWFENK
jgi:hypothetical protein